MKTRPVGGDSAGARAPRSRLGPVRGSYRHPRARRRNGASHGERLEAELRDTILELRRSRARVAHTDGLAFEVRDDGRGFDPALRRGSGLANMEDRLAAVGGRVKVVLAPECGAAVHGWVPGHALVS
jgi:hypothetical protein